jgi:RNA polymerase sigma-70 factor (ECF subfamily)
LRRSHYPLITDEELVLSALLGNLEAYDELVRRFRGAVFLIARQALGSREAAEDLAQEVFLLAFKALPQLKDPAKFPGWLCAITRRRAWRAADRAQRIATAEATQLDMLILAGSHELGSPVVGGLIRQAENERIAAALETLPTDYWSVLHLYYDEEWNVARIADFLSLTPATVKWRLYQGRKLLCRRLGEQEREE